MGGFEKKIIKFWRYFYENGGYNDVLLGLKNTLLIAIIGLVIGIVIGILIAAVRVMPKEKKSTGVLNSVCDVYVSFFRGTPIVVQLLLTHYVFLPLIGLNLRALVVSIIVFGLNSGAYVSEIMRSGIQSVDPGQMEAGRALGLNFPTTMMKIVVPQAVKNILPTLGNEFIVLVKETSVVSFVGTADLYMAFQYIGTDNYEYMVPYLVMAIIYIVLVMAITFLVKILERRLGKSDRRN
jgi:polar amino acid transport system permease protein